MTCSLSRPAIFFAKVITTDLKQAYKISIDKYVLDTKLTMYFKEKSEVYALRDSGEKYSEGDYVIAKEIPYVPCEGKRIEYSIEKLVYKNSHWIDPVSGRKNAGFEYTDDIMKTTELFGCKRPYQNSDNK